MYLLYLIALVPVFIGLLLFMFTKKVAWVEWVVGAALSFLIAAMFHGCAVYSMTADVETWSGQLVKACHHPEWVEKYYVIHHTYDDKGRVTGSYTTTHYRTHTEFWTTESNIDTAYDIDKGFYERISKEFGGKVEITQPYKDGFDSGDRNLYTVYNNTGYVFPITKLVSFTNRVKAGPTLFSFAKVPEAMDKKIYSYPGNKDPFKSDRLMGCAANTIGLEEFDRMNARLGPRKLVNVILAGYVDTDPSLAEWQRAKWVGGKKNDLVICYGVKGDPKKAQWCRVFGWTEKDSVKRGLESVVMDNPVDNSILDKVETEIQKDYVIKDWTKFDYITIEPSTGIIIWMVVLMVFTQVGFWIFALLNDISNFEDLERVMGNGSGRYPGYY